MKEGKEPKPRLIYKDVWVVYEPRVDLPDIDAEIDLNEDMEMRHYDPEDDPEDLGGYFDDNLLGC